MDQTPNEVTHLIERLRSSDRPALGELFHCYRDRLRRMVELRMDPRLRARVDASDVLQEASLELAGDLEAYCAAPSCRPCSGCGCTSAGG
jgi:RNA polymerase sigma-70 factor (ECF subfamily)